jgi:hypothetical protein
MNFNSFEFVESVLVENITKRSNDIYNFNRYKMGRFDIRPRDLKHEYTRESYLDYLIEKAQEENKEDRLKLESIRNKIKNKAKYEEPVKEMSIDNPLGDGKRFENESKEDYDIRMKKDIKPIYEIKKKREGIIITKDNVSDHCEACKAYGKREDCFLCKVLLEGIEINIVEPKHFE